ncbi:hypothetical protein [Nostoc sp. UHCC 0252]|uniref:hypothetical protein n=1 Tax=Nostoc sp. UHCC 0252 TaxID=3110241 RepID=UPI002B206F8A|nr:hypothetical protein [Nostoc sp. UHCC 0252]MEA5605751.1 hypothetical protein [Nostoc sp. UHCC 0252]
MGYSIIIKPKTATQQRLELPESDAMACPQLDIWICLDLAKNQRQARKIKTLAII